ncbi:diguanylate cyclase [Massilia sp. 9096]|uniref:tetratricopeptide repeat-containing diguanylate cyclase n=1 Tax=Massilia sp. 9096 TaxID=1500894 RepID=UPI0005655997|nr:diguanylate cyclase [Massilia sp. 9096]
MLASLIRASQPRRSHALLAALWLAFGAAAAQDLPSHQRFSELREMARVSPQRAVPVLDRLQAEARRGTPAEQADFLIASCDVQHLLGQHATALGLCDQAIAIGRLHHNDDILASALMAKAYALFSLNETAQSHQLIWEAEKLLSASRDVGLRVRAQVSSGESFAEDGNLPLALTKIQGATLMARQSGDPLLLVIALRALGKLYDQMREYAKGFEAVDEGMRVAEAMQSPGRLLLLKGTEYALAIDSGQPQRALKAQLAALDLAHKVGAGPMMGDTLVNLSDVYLKLGDYHHALSYAQQALARANELNDEGLAGVARLNIGEVYLAMGRIPEGKTNMEAGLAWFEKAGKKPDLLNVLIEYGESLEKAGDLSGALAAYHRERKLSNEMFERRRQKAMLELQEKYEADKKQRQIELLRQENQVKSTEIDNRRLQQRVWWLLAVVFGLASAIVGLLYRKVRHANAQLEEKNQELKQQSVRDPLTALYNRRHFQEFMRGRQDGERRGNAGRAAGDDTVSALYLLDVDHFKHINDTYGHGAGDAVLREIAAALRDILRETDMIVRWGGEEFLAFLPAVPRASLDEVARRLLNGIPARTIDYQGATLSAQVSIGFAPFPLAPGAEIVSWERAVNIVDMALYLAKGHGRNRAYGVRSFDGADGASMNEIEHDIEAAWRAGHVELSIVMGPQPELRMVS